MLIRFVDICVINLTMIYEKHWKLQLHRVVTHICFAYAALSVRSRVARKALNQQLR
jgi:hypothetical protein